MGRRIHKKKKTMAYGGINLRCQISLPEKCSHGLLETNLDINPRYGDPYIFIGLHSRILKSYHEKLRKLEYDLLVLPGISKTTVIGCNGFTRIIIFKHLPLAAVGFYFNMH